MNTFLQAVRQRMNEARLDYEVLRQRLGTLNRAIGTKEIPTFWTECGPLVIGQLKADRARVFGDMNRARAKLRRYMKMVEEELLSVRIAKHWTQIQSHITINTIKH